MHRVNGSSKAYHTVWGWVKGKKGWYFGEARPCIYMVQKGVFRDHTGNQENIHVSSKMTQMTSGKFLVAEGTSRKGF